MCPKRWNGPKFKDVSIDLSLLLMIKKVSFIIDIKLNLQFYQHNQCCALLRLKPYINYWQIVPWIVLTDHSPLSECHCSGCVQDSAAVAQMKKVASMVCALRISSSHLCYCVTTLIPNNLDTWNIRQQKFSSRCEQKLN